MKRILTFMFVITLAIGFAFVGCKKEGDAPAEDAKVEEKAEEAAPAEEPAKKEEAKEEVAK